MNRIYSLRYSAVTSGFIAVSELATRCTCRVAGKMLLKATSLLLLLLLISGSSGASTVSSEIDYQIFRDFAENKGMFHPMATDIAIYNKHGELVSTRNKGAMPDFSSVNVKSVPGVATLINPQYVASVKHNGGYYGVRFGDGENYYSIVDRNEHDSVDFHAPRLDKLVTEVVPATVTSASKADIVDLPRKFSAFYRLGSGVQYIQDVEGNEIQLVGGYSYLTGGTLPAWPYSYNTSSIRIWVGDNVNNLDVMASIGQAGDSGSPLFGWNETQGQWEFIGVYYAVLLKSKNELFNLIPQV